MPDRLIRPDATDSSESIGLVHKPRGQAYERDTRFILILLCAFGACAGENDERAGHHAAGAQGEAAGPETLVAASNDNKMRQQMKRMQDVMQRIHCAGDPQLRKELPGEHLDTMEETMKTPQDPEPDRKGCSRSREYLALELT
jgi:hypothetical protein